MKANPFFRVRDLVPYFRGVYHNQFLLFESIARANVKIKRLPLNLVCRMDTYNVYLLNVRP